VLGFLLLSACAMRNSTHTQETTPTVTDEVRALYLPGSGTLQDKPRWRR
jgi:hypothetical protein